MPYQSPSAIQSIARENGGAGQSVSASRFSLGRLKDSGVETTSDVNCESQRERPDAQLFEELEENLIATGFSSIDGDELESQGLSQTKVQPAIDVVLKIIARGEKDRLQGKGLSAAESRAQLVSARTP